MFYLVNDKRCSTTFHYTENDPWDYTNLRGLIAAFNTTIIALLQNVWSDQVRIEQLYARCLVPDTVQTANEYIIGGTGLLTGQAAPSNLAVVISLRQGEVSSRANNRLMIAGFSEDDVENSVLSPAAAAGHWSSLNTGLLAPLTAGAGSPYDLVCVGYQLGGVSHPAAGYEVLESVVELNISSQRRRRTEFREIKS